MAHIQRRCTAPSNQPNQGEKQSPRPPSQGSDCLATSLLVPGQAPPSTSQHVDSNNGPQHRGEGDMGQATHGHKGKGGGGADVGRRGKREHPARQGKTSGKGDTHAMQQLSLSRPPLSFIVPFLLRAPAGVVLLPPPFFLIFRSRPRSGTRPVPSPRSRGSGLRGRY